MTNHPLDGLQALGINDVLKKMGVYVVDVETTGLKKTDNMFSAAFSKLDDNGDAIRTEERFFHPPSVKEVNRQHMSDQAVADEYEARLAKAHSSPVFGERQRTEGSLRPAAVAMAKKEVVSPGHFLGELSKELGTGKNGNVVLTHNANFENSQFNRLEGMGNQKYDAAYSAMKNRNVGNEGGLFGASKQVSNWSDNPDQMGLSQRIRQAHTEYVTALKEKANPDVVRKSLEAYAGANKDMMNNMVEQIKSVHGKSGAYTGVDTMHMLRALMSFGALNGDVDSGNLQLGGKIEHQALAWLKRKETHQAGDDTVVQGKIAKKLFTELEEYAKDGTRKSPLMKELNDFINSNNIATETFKSSIGSEVSNTTKYTSRKDYIKGVEDWIDKTLDNYSTASGSHEERTKIASSYKAELEKQLKDEPSIGKEKLSQNLEVWAKNNLNNPFEPSSKKADWDNITKHSKEFLGKHKNKVALAGLALAGTMFVDGGKKGEGVSYNTYDEVYNNQYYGAGFADWQNRNNAHRILY